MKKLSFLFWDIFTYILLYFNYTISSYLKNIASKEFNTNYNFLVILLNSILFIIIGITYNIIANVKNTESQAFNYSIWEFVIIGLNSLFIATIFVWLWLDIYFLPNWLMENIMVTSSLGSVIFGLELYRFIKNYVLKILF